MASCRRLTRAVRSGAATRATAPPWRSRLQLFGTGLSRRCTCDCERRWQSYNPYKTALTSPALRPEVEDGRYRARQNRPARRNDISYAAADLDRGGNAARGPDREVSDGD